jgi:hypothetical protein
MTLIVRRFPPTVGNLLLPVDSRSAARAGLACYAACRTRTRGAQILAYGIAGALGPRAVPGRTTSWSPPMNSDIWLDLRRRWRAIAGDSDHMVVFERRHSERSGFATLLLDGGRPILFVKIGLRSDGVLAREFHAQSLVASSEPVTFRVPRPLNLDSVGNWSSLAMEPLPSAFSSPPRRPPLGAIVAEIRSSLAAIPRPPEVPSHWEPMHGDFTPANLRQYPAGFLTLIDWEQVGWGPPAADETHYIAWSAALRGKVPAFPNRMEESRRYWLTRVRSWGPETERSFVRTRRALESALAGPAGDGG